MKRTLIVSLVLIFAGSFLASMIQTTGGVKVQDVRFTGGAGQLMSGLLYIPDTATIESPQPAVLAIHGYINSRETQSGFAIELSRRGFVVLALDQTGHGFSDPPAFSNGFGGPDGLQYLRNLPFVDKDRIALEGHSMGGWAALMAANAFPEGYAAIVLEGSSTGTLGTGEGTPSFPRNLLLVFSRFDEFSALMWESDIPDNIVKTGKLKKLFNSDADIEVGRIYGAVENGTARKLAMPSVTHPGDHLSTEAIGEAVQWLQEILSPQQFIAAENQIWYWKELGTFLALLGIAILIFPLSQLILSKSGYFPLQAEMPEFNAVEGKGWYLAAMVTGLIPIITFFPLQTFGSLAIPANSIWSQSITNGILVWMLGNAFISIVLFILWLKFGKNNISTIAQLGLGNRRELARSVLFAAAVVLVLYFMVLLVEFLFLTDFRIWVVALKRMSVAQFYQFLVYLPDFCLFFIVLGATLHSQLSIRNSSVGRAMIVNSLVLSIGYVMLLAFQYAPLLMGGTLAIASQPLLTIVAFQFVPLMILVACVSTWCFYRTASVYPGGLLNGMFVCWYVVAGQATQAIPLLG